MDNMIYRDGTMVFGISPKKFDFLSLAKFDSKEEATNARFKIQKTFLEYLSLEHVDFIIPYQTHGTDIVRINKTDIYNKNSANAEQYSQDMCNADGIYTFDKDIILGVTVADCAGIILYDKNTGFIAALHSGWKGTCGMPDMEHNRIPTDSILYNCIKIYKQEHAKTSNNLRAWISPCAKSCCYEVGEEFIDYFSKYPQCMEQRKGKYYLDISAYIRHELLEQGLKEESIVMSSECTICNKHFHSHRRGQRNSKRASQTGGQLEVPVIAPKIAPKIGRSVVYVGNILF